MSSEELKKECQCMPNRDGLCRFCGNVWIPILQRTELKKEWESKKEYFNFKDRKPEYRERRRIRENKQKDLPERKAQVLRAAKKYQMNNAIKTKARDAVKVALRNGTIIRKPCVVCSDFKSSAHHPDYNQPLSVIFLCDKHHKQFHIVDRACAKINDSKISSLLAKQQEEFVKRVSDSFMFRPFEQELLVKMAHNKLAVNIIAMYTDLIHKERDRLLADIKSKLNK
jgi:hypothetical protein